VIERLLEFRKAISSLRRFTRQPNRY
jgi:hypothetical protein